MSSLRRFDRLPSTRFALPALCSLLVLFGGTSCATETQTPSPSRINEQAARAGEPGTPSTPEATSEFREISLLYSRGSYDAAIQRLQAFEKTYPTSPLLPQAENLHGLSYLLT